MEMLQVFNDFKSDSQKYLAFKNGSEKLFMPSFLLLGDQRWQFYLKSFKEAAYAQINNVEVICQVKCLRQITILIKKSEFGQKQYSEYTFVKKLLVIYVS